MMSFLLTLVIRFLHGEYSTYYAQLQYSSINALLVQKRLISEGIQQNI